MDAPARWLIGVMAQETQLEPMLALVMDALAAVHAVRNPITAISMTAELLEAGTRDERVREACRYIRRDVARIEEEVERLQQQIRESFASA